jgi:DNA topoisomerase-3
VLFVCSASTPFAWSRVRLFDRAVCVILYDMCVESPQATVLSVIEKPTSKWRPVPLATIEFQKAASSKLHMTSDNAMKV